ncbi:hypothetical protein Q3V30_22165 (plasmid) [Erwinia pyri]|uniref:Uncharacterized protein n=1 Tax=Erwinia pyri TaxID=3062598 RepID=A0AA50DNF5_9GAMM|nr:hypothetical protein [Erwinia sp. DE2]WLS81164.1 hypothetical protein Q3V30_22165 [Erwinia sp. DE2]
MNVQTEKIFREIYRQFKKVNPGCDDKDKLDKVLNKIIGVGKYSSNPARVRAMEEMHGFCICCLDYKMFIPSQSALNLKKENLKFYADAFSEAEIIIPTYIPMNVLGPLSQEIIKVTDKEEKLKQGDMALAAMFPPSMLARLSIDHYSKFSDLSPCLVQIRETVEAYCLGFYRLSITSLLPCIEYAIRALGEKLGVAGDNEVAVSYLLGIYDSWMRYYIDGVVLKDYDWAPDCVRSKNLYLNFDERYQMVANSRDYIANHLYQNSIRDKGISQLNRHSILHGFMPEYHTKGNYLRLINVLNNLCFMLTLSGVPASLFLPEATDKTMRFIQNLLVMEVMGTKRAMYLDENSIER